MLMGALFSEPTQGADGMAIASSPDGRIEAFFAAANPQGALFHAFQQGTTDSASDLGAWTRWASYAPPPDDPSQVVAASDGAGRVMVAWLSGGAIWFIRQNSPNAGMQPAAKIATHNLTSLSLAKNADGRLELFSLDDKGSAWSTYQNAPGDWNWSNLTLGGHDLKQLAPTSFADGRLALVALGSDGRVYLKTQAGPGATWLDWTGLEGKDIRYIDAGANADGRLNVVAIGGDGSFYDRSTEVGATGNPGYGAWSDWRRNSGGPYIGEIKLRRNADGRLNVFMRKNANPVGLVHLSQMWANASWSDAALSVVPGTIPGFDVVSIKPDGRLAAIVYTGEFAAPNASTHAKRQFKVATQQGANSEWVTSSTQPDTLFQPPPSIAITNFAANPGATEWTAVPQGGSSTLSWSFAPKDGCTPAELWLHKKDYGLPEELLLHNPQPSASGSLAVVASPPVSSPIHYNLSVGCRVAPNSTTKATATLWFTTASSTTPGPVPFVNGPNLSPDPPRYKQDFEVSVVVGNAGGGEIPKSSAQLYIDHKKEGEAKEVPKLGAGETHPLTWSVSKELDVRLNHDLEVKNSETNASWGYRQFEVAP